MFESKSEIFEAKHPKPNPMGAAPNNKKRKNTRFNLRLEYPDLSATVPELARHVCGVIVLAEGPKDFYAMDGMVFHWINNQ